MLNLYILKLGQNSKISFVYIHLHFVSPILPIGENARKLVSHNFPSKNGPMWMKKQVKQCLKKLIVFRSIEDNQTSSPELSEKNTFCDALPSAPLQSVINRIRPVITYTFSF